MANSSLLQWLATFELDGQTSVELKNDAYYNLADGYVCARILNQISPQYFSNKWLDGIKPVPPNGSWRLRVSNLKRILQKIHDYASDLQSPQFTTNAIAPDVAVIAQNFDPDQISRLIQLILFCAINCDKKQYYIKKIHDLPTQVKQDIKEAIEELLIKHDDSYSQRLNVSQTGNDSVQSDANSSFKSNTGSTHGSEASPLRSAHQRNLLRRDSSQLSTEARNLDISSQSDHPEALEKLKQRLEEVQLLQEEKSQALHELELKFKQVQLERDQLAYENEKKNERSQSNISKTTESRRASASHGLLEMTSKLARDDDESKGEDYSSEAALVHSKKLQHEIHQLKDEIIRIETEKEEFRLKSNLLQEDLDKITVKHDEFKKKAEQAKRLQDELDELRQMSEKVINYETMMENLMKKNNEMKRENKSLEEKNLTHIQNVVRLEEENNRLSNAVSRFDIYKKQLQDAQVKLSEETHRADKAEIELSRITERYTATRKENERLYETTNQLIQSNHGAPSKSAGLDTNEKFGQSMKGFTSVNLGGSSPNGSRENENTSSTLDLRERLTRLEAENELLQNKVNSKRENDNVILAGLLENSDARCSKLEIENRQSKKRILLLESRLKDLTTMQGGSGPSTSAAIVPDSSSDNVLALMNRVEELQRLLFSREQELMESESKYRKNIQKAKEVIKSLNNNQSLNASLHPSCMSSASSFNSSSLDEANLLRQQLKEREDKLIEIEREFSEYKRIKELHERLILSAFYGLTIPMQRKNAEKRLERTTLTSPPNTASSSLNHSKHSH